MAGIQYYQKLNGTSRTYGLKSKNFKDLNNLIKNKKFTNALISNVNSILSLSKKNLIHNNKL